MAEVDPPNSEPQTTSGPQTGLLACLVDNIAWVIIFVVAIAICFSIEPIGRNGFYGSHYYRFCIAITGCALVLIRYGLSRYRSIPTWPWSLKTCIPGQHLVKGYYTLLTVICIAGIFNYYQFDSRKFIDVADNADITYYYINSKYFTELGYFELYPAMLIADREKGNRLRSIRRYRDLHSYDLKTIKYALSNSKRIKARFEPSRWQQFKHDVDYLVRNNIAGGWSYFFIDHGYNPPPAWTLVGGFLSRITPVENINLIAKIDFIMVAGMFVIIAITFNAEVMLYSLLFFICTFSGRWPVLGGSLLRFDWVTTLVVGVCMMKCRRPYIAGALLMYASLNRIFPAIFFWPWFASAAWQIWKNRTIAADDKRLALGAASLLGLMLIGVLAVYGPGAIEESRKNLAQHASAKSYSSHRVGLPDAVFYRGEMKKYDLSKSGGIDAKAEKIGDYKRLFQALGLLSIVLIAVYTIRTGRLPYETTFLATLILFCMQTPQINYYNLRVLFIMSHAANLGRWQNRLGLLILFSTEIVTQWSHVNKNIRYATTTITSIGLCIYFAVLLAFLAFELAQTYRKKAGSEAENETPFIARLLPFPSLLRWGGLTSAALCLVVVPCLAISGKPRYSPRQNISANYKKTTGKNAEKKREIYVRHASIKRKKAPGSRWNARGNITFSSETVLVDLGTISHARSIEMGADNNDVYRVQFLLNGKTIFTKTLPVNRKEVLKGIAINTFSVPQKVASMGYQKLRISGSRGDRRYSISHILLLDPSPTPSGNQNP